MSAAFFISRQNGDAMPYKLSKDGMSVLKDDGTLVKRHKSKKQARAHLAALKINVQEAGARHSGSDMTMLQTIHDHAVELGATCQPMQETLADILKRQPRTMEALSRWLKQ